MPKQRIPHVEPNFFFIIQNSPDLTSDGRIRAPIINKADFVPEAFNLVCQSICLQYCSKIDIIQDCNQSDLHKQDINV